MKEQLIFSQISIFPSLEWSHIKRNMCTLFEIWRNNYCFLKSSTSFRTAINGGFSKIIYVNWLIVIIRTNIIQCLLNIYNGLSIFILLSFVLGKSRCYLSSELLIILQQKGICFIVHDLALWFLSNYSYSNFFCTKTLV